MAQVVLAVDVVTGLVGLGATANAPTVSAEASAPQAFAQCIFPFWLYRRTRHVGPQHRPDQGIRLCSIQVSRLFSCVPALNPSKNSRICMWLHVLVQCSDCLASS